MAVETRLTLKGGWIDAAYDGEMLTMAAVGSTLQFLLKAPTSIPARHKQSEERGRLRRLAIAALLSAGAPDSIEDAEVAWTYRADEQPKGRLHGPCPGMKTGAVRWAWLARKTHAGLLTMTSEGKLSAARHGLWPRRPMGSARR